MHFQHFVLLPFDETPLPAHMLTIFFQDVDNVLLMSLILFFVEVTSSHGYLGPIPGCLTHWYLDSFPDCVRDFPCFKPHFCPSLRFFFFSSHFQHLAHCPPLTVFSFIAIWHKFGDILVSLLLAALSCIEPQA